MVCKARHVRCDVPHLILSRFARIVQPGNRSGFCKKPYRRVCPRAPGSAIPFIPPSGQAMGSAGSSIHLFEGEIKDALRQAAGV